MYLYGHAKKKDCSKVQKLEERLFLLLNERHCCYVNKAPFLFLLPEIGENVISLNLSIPGFRNKIYQ